MPGDEQLQIIPPPLFLFHLDVFFSAYISELKINKHILVEYFRPHRPCQELTTKLQTTDNIYSNHFHFPKKGKSRPRQNFCGLSLFCTRPPKTRFTATEASVLVLKIILSSAQILSLSSSSTAPDNRFCSECRPLSQFDFLIGLVLT